MATTHLRARRVSWISRDGVYHLSDPEVGVSGAADLKYSGICVLHVIAAFTLTC